VEYYRLRVRAERDSQEQPDDRTADARPPRLLPEPRDV